MLDEHSPSISKSVGNKKVWTAYKGKYSPYALPNQDVSSPGYTIIMHRPFQSTSVFLLDIDEAIDTLDNHEENFEEYCEIDKKIGEYLSSDEGKWGR